MRCAACQQENPEEAKFCNACGTKLEAVCPQCEHVNLPRSRFCNECGSPLTAQPRPPVSSFKFQVSSSQPPASSPQPPSSYTPQHLAARILAEQGRAEEGIAQIRQGLAAYRATGIEEARPYALAWLAEAYGKVGQAEEGLSALAEALALVDKTGARVYEAELYRLKGQLTLQKFQVSGSKFQVPNPQPLIPNPQAEAEACFHKAIEIARRQQAKSLELRAVMSLGRLWQQQGKQDEARQMLAEIYGWFTEGFDTKDLQEARALLEELAS